MLPRLGSRLVTTWMMATLAVSIVIMVGGFSVYGYLALSPERIWHGQVWRLFTWALIEPSPLGLVITCACIYKFGGELAVRWGDRRLRRFMLQLIIAAGVVTAVLALMSPVAWRMYRPAGWVIDDVLIIAWARQFPNSPVTFFGFLSLTGNRIIQLTLGITLLLGLANGPFVMAPELTACFAAAFYPRGWLERA